MVVVQLHEPFIVVLVAQHLYEMCVVYSQEKRPAPRGLQST